MDFKFKLTLLGCLPSLIATTTHTHSHYSSLDSLDFEDFEHYDGTTTISSTRNNDNDLTIPINGFSYRYKNQHKDQHNLDYRLEHDLPIRKILKKRKSAHDIDYSSSTSIPDNNLYKEGPPPHPYNFTPFKSVGLSYSRGLSAEWDSIAFKRSGSLTTSAGQVLDLSDFERIGNQPNEEIEMAAALTSSSTLLKGKWGPDDPDYMWYDPYETESLFTDFTKYVTELHATEQDEGEVFNDTVYYSKKPWMVIFYAHWCGHCQAYVPQFKEFVRFLFSAKSSWRAVMNIGTVNCGSEKEAKVCRQQLISSYPRIRYYRSWLSPNKLVDGKTNNMRRGLLHTGSKSPNNLLKATLDFLVKNSENQEKSNKGWRVYWRRKSGMPAPMLDTKKSSKVADKVLRNQYRKRSTRYVVVLYHQQATSSQVVVMGLSNFRGITVFHKVQAPARANYALLYEYCKPHRKIKFRNRDQMIAELTKLPGVEVDVDLYDTSVREGNYPPKTPAQCKAYENPSSGESSTIRPKIDPRIDTITQAPEPEPTRPPVIVEEKPTKPTIVITKPPKPSKPSIGNKPIYEVDASKLIPTSDHAEALAKILKNDIPIQIEEYPEKQGPTAVFLQTIYDLRVGYEKNLLKYKDVNICHL